MNTLDPATVEVSLIGPGYGESIIIHIGGGEWIIVDSCVRQSDQGPQSAAVAYLRELGVDPASQVSRVVATHWHDDHIGGLSAAVDDCLSAEFCCAAALREQEFLGFAAVYAEADPSPIARSTHEIVEILELLRARDKTPVFLSSDTLIRRAERASVYALSPSNERIIDFLARSAANMPELGATRRRASDLSPNAIAVVLLVDFGEDAILLGADLEESPGGAWTAIVASSEAIRGRRSSDGSQNAECAAIWETLLVDSPFAILTPSNRGRLPLPSEADVERILERTSDAFSSARLSPTARRRYDDPSVERTIRESGWKIRSAEPRPGHVRLRRRMGDSAGKWTVELFDDARELRHIRR